MKKKQKSRTKAKRGVEGLRVVREAVAGIDLGADQHWVAGPPGSADEANVKTFGTTTPELKRLATWLSDQGIESVAMESTHVYWIPVYELLESEGFEVVLVNARQLRHVPGRKTDFQDCQWIQQLHSYGLLRGSFRPHETVCRLRAIRRHAANLVAERSRAIQWMQKSLDQMNVQVHRAVADLTGKTGLAIVRAIVSGERDVEALAQLRDRRCKKSVAEIAGHLTGTWRDEHLFTLASALRLFDHLQVEIDECNRALNAELEQLTPPERQDVSVPSHPNKRKESAMRRSGEQPLREALYGFAGVDLTRIDGVSAATAAIVLTEVGDDLTSFPSEKHFVSWLRLCPNRAVSGGKVLKKRTNGMGANRVSGALRVAARSLIRTKTALGAYYRRVARRATGKTALFAVARKLAIFIYRALRFGTEYVDIGQDEYNRQFEAQRVRALHKTADELGYVLTPKPTMATTPAA